MTTLMPGRFQFMYNLGTGDIRTFDIFDDGQIQETIAKTSEVNRVSTDHAMKYIIPMIALREKEMKKMRTVPLQSKVTKTKYEILKTIKRFMEDNYIGEDDIRYF